MGAKKRLACLVVGASVLSGILSGCALVQPLGRLASTMDSQSGPEKEVRIDAELSENLTSYQRLAWAAFSVTVECHNDCPLGAPERAWLAREIGERAFGAADEGLRAVFGEHAKLASIEETRGNPQFAKFEIENHSYRRRVNRWLERFGLGRSRDLEFAVRGLKASDPTELGWRGGESLAKLAQLLAVDAVLVGHVRVISDPSAGNPYQLKIQGPRIWVFSGRPDRVRSSDPSRAIVAASLRTEWRPDAREVLGDSAKDPSLASVVSFSGIETVARGLGTRVARQMSR